MVRSGVSKKSLLHLQRCHFPRVSKRVVTKRSMLIANTTPGETQLWYIILVQPVESKVGICLRVAPVHRADKVRPPIETFHQATMLHIIGCLLFKEA